MRLPNDQRIDRNYDGSELISQGSILDLRYGGENGYMPIVSGLSRDGQKFIELLNAQPYVSQNLIPFTMYLPGFLDFMPNSNVLKDTFISLFETHPESIEGIDAQLTIETETTKISRTNQVLRSVTGSNRPECNITYTIKEKHGKPVQNFLEMYARYGIRDDITDKPLVTLLDTFPDDAETPTPAELRGFGTLFVEPSYDHRTVVDAYLVLDQFITSTGEHTAKMSIEGNGELKTYTIETGGYMIYNSSIRELGQIMLDRMRANKIHPDTVVSPIDPNNLEAAVKDTQFNIDGAVKRTTKS